MKEFLKKLFPSIVQLRNRIYNSIAHYRFKGKPVDEVFLKIYQENHWRDPESLSGTGSNERSTAEVIRIVNQVLGKYNIKTILDIPCGDFNWMKKVKLAGIDYIGGDIIDSLIERNDKNFSNASVSFRKINLLESTLPSVDLIFIRDCLVHFSYTDIHKALVNIRKSGCTYLLTTTFPDHKNYNIVTGDWRPINLELSPFNLPAPLAVFKEHCQEDKRYEDKSLALWRISDL
jgi:SAM-dependent methyltransferase